MTTAADIFKQYARTVLAQPGEYIHDLEPDTQTLALIVRKWGSTPIPDGEVETIRNNLTMCPAGQYHWCLDCDQYRCNEEDQMSHASVSDVPSDPINPAHYQGFSNGAQVIDIVEHLPYNRGAAVKYLVRAGKKDPTKHVEDLKKSAWYVAREIERIEGGSHG